MRKSIFTMLFMLLGMTTSFAQKVSVPEPEFADQTFLLTSNTEYVKLPRESGVVKTKAGASLYLVGIGKVKTRITLSGPTSSVTVPAGKDVCLIIKAANNSTDPESFINIFPFEVKVRNVEHNWLKLERCLQLKQTLLDKYLFRLRSTDRVLTILL